MNKFFRRKPKPVISRIATALALGSATTHKSQGRFFRNMMWRR